jgi:nucleoid DNA-binding protein
MKLVKLDIVRLIAKRIPTMSQHNIEKVVNEFLRAINIALLNQDIVIFKHFGRFWVVKYKRKIGRNPHTNLPIPIEPSWKVKFASCKGMKRRLNAK